MIDLQSLFTMFYPLYKANIIDLDNFPYTILVVYRNFKSLRMGKSPFFVGKSYNSSGKKKSIPWQATTNYQRLLQLKSPYEVSQIRLTERDAKADKTENTGISLLSLLEDTDVRELPLSNFFANPNSNFITSTYHDLGGTWFSPWDIMWVVPNQSNTTHDCEG